MRFFWPSFRLLIKSGSTIVLLLLTASLAQAAPGPGRRAGRLCDPQSTATIRKLARHPKSFGGPVKRFARPSGSALLSDLTARLQRGKRAPAADDDEAIQNDAPAARIDVDDGQPPALRQLGLLIGLVDRHPRTRAYSPRSPRGPPALV